MGSCLFAVAPLSILGWDIPLRNGTFSISSVVLFRACGLKACAFECVTTRGALLIAATSQNPRSLRCDRSIKIPNRLQAPISSLPRSVRPGPVSGEEGQRNGTPWPNAFDRLQTG